VTSNPRAAAAAHLEDAGRLYGRPCVHEHALQCRAMADEFQRNPILAITACGPGSMGIRPGVLGHPAPPPVHLSSHAASMGSAPRPER